MQATERRNDPRPRLSRLQMAGQVDNKREDRQYVLANPSDELCGLPIHLDDGWQKISAKDDKERVIGGRVEKNGDVTFRGQVLVWLDKAEYESREADKRALVAVRNNKKVGPGGLDGVVDAQGKPAQNTIENR
jgi:hypothetical protein